MRHLYQGKLGTQESQQDKYYGIIVKFPLSTETRTGTVH